MDDLFVIGVVCAAIPFWGFVVLGFGKAAVTLFGKGKELDES